MARVLIVDDDVRIVRFLSEMVESWGHTPASAHTIRECLDLAGSRAFDLVLLDLELPDGDAIRILPDITRSPGHPEVIIITGTGGLKGAKLAFKYGAWDYVQKPFIMEEVFLPVSRALAYREEKIQATPVTLKRSRIIGESGVITNCLDQVARAASTNVSVLITGKTGTGKELFARAIHDNCTRSDGAFVPINCGAIPETLAESVFFGHTKGAFTGADTARQGVIIQADRGTLFLDEIGDLPLPLQVSLLRVLQEKKIRPIGSRREIPVDFRLVSATNRDLNRMVSQKKFRQDLLFRIRSLTIDLPRLTERGDDLEEIATYQIRRICRENRLAIKGISPEFFDVLKAHTWPGNVRELKSVLEAALASIGADPTLYPKHLPPEYRAAVFSAPEVEAGESPPYPEPFPTLGQVRHNAEKEYLELLIRRAGGDRQKAVLLSGISQARLYDLLKKHGLSLLRQGPV